ncbi:hypothetical protein G6F21_012149 [Rhizopus arrhizus]|nr:hypothetical protein G6F21_012149 [Rhizopus arrhizus]
MEVAVDSISCSDLSFMSAEYKLKSSDEEYKADACILDDDNNEISILETSGKFMLDDNSKYGYDHVKYILALGNLVWLYREELEKTVKTLKKMKKEHNSYEFERMLGSDDARESLSKMVNSDIQRPIQGAGFGILLSEKKDDEESVVRFIKGED